MIKSKYPLLISLQAESTDRPLHLSERASLGLRHTPLTQTFSSNKLTHSAAFVPARRNFSKVSNDARVHTSFKPDILFQEGSSVFLCKLNIFFAGGH